MIAYDLDGVFLSDIKPFNNSLEYMLKARLELAPNFIPKGLYSIITGRPESDKKDTERWVDKFLNENRPVYLFHDNPDFGNPHLYKLKVLKENPSIMTFIESDIGQVLFLREELKDRDIKIIHFEELIKSSLERLQYE